MPSKLQKAIGAVKDQTSLSLAKVVKSHSIDVAVLKATSHDDVPVDDSHVAEVLALVSSDPTRVKSCAHAIARRVGRTRNWVVALKSLVLVERVLQNDAVLFPREVQNANILNLKNFSDDSNSSPRDFVGAFAHYLHDRVESILTGQLGDHPVLLDKIVTWQRLLDRIIKIKPAGSAGNNRLIQNSLYGLVRESFDLHRDVFDGLDLLLGTFFHLPYDSCVNSFQAFLKASKQFEELSEFYEFCKKTGVGTTSEYPNVQNISEELLETLKEFLKDQSNFTCPSPSPALESSIPAPTDNVSDFDVTYRSGGDDDGSSSFIPVDRVSISNSVLDLASFDNDRTLLESQRQERRDQSGHGYKQSWEIVLFDESKSTDPKQCVDFDILSQATPSQRWTNPFLNELMPSLPSTPENQSGFNFSANSSSPATHDRNDPFNAPSTYDEPTFRTTLEEAAHEDMNAASNDSNDCLPSFLEMPLQNDVSVAERHNVEEISLQSDAFAHVTPPQRHSIAEMPLHNDAYAVERHNVAHMPVQNVPFQHETLPQSDITTRMPLQNDLFAIATPSPLHNDPFMLAEPSQLQNALFSPITPAQSHDTTQMPLQNDPFAPATPSQLQNDPFAHATPSKLHNDPSQSRNTTQMPPPNDLYVSSTQSKHHNDPFVPETPSQLQNARPLNNVTTRMSLHNDLFGPTTPTQLQDVPFMPATPPQQQNVPFPPTTLPQRHITTQMSLHNDPFGLATPTQSQNVPFSLATPPQSHITTTMPLQNDSSAPATPPQSHSTTYMQPQNDPFEPATPPQRHNILQLENDPFTPPTTPPQRHNTSQMSLHNDPFTRTTPTQSHNTTQLLQQHNDPFVPIATLSVLKDSFPPATQPQHHNELKMQSQNENDPFTSAVVPQRHNASARDANQPTFQASPTFFAKESNNNSTLQNGDDPFAATATSEGQDISHEKQLWLEYQNKIIAKHRT